jgi:hypothetical protein
MESMGSIAYFTEYSNIRSPVLLRYCDTRPCGISGGLFRVMAVVAGGWCRVEE